MTFCIDWLCNEPSVTLNYNFFFLPWIDWQDGNDVTRKCLVLSNIHIVTAWFIYIRLLGVRVVAFFSLWEIRCVCVWVRSLHVLYVCEWVCASPLLWITSLSALHVCVWVWDGELKASWCFFYCACSDACSCCLSARLQVYLWFLCVLMHGPCEESEPVGVRYVCVRVC